ncbi:MAG: VWA domain-containing protein [Acidobacteriaceae bacterium]|jgi:Ca-activated chloride channel family protein|nr:VWA domain-containing protein [Acidobacteriaceae bacterium]
MKRIRYTKYKGDLAGEISLDDLMGAMSDYLLDSGFNDPLAKFQELNGDLTMDNLREAIRQALEDGDLLTDEQREKLEEMDPAQQEEFLDQMIERMQQENYINADLDNAELSDEPGSGGPQDDGPTEARFEVTDKSMDFLGYRTLRDLLGSLGKSSFGRHETVHLASGIEAVGASRPYEFGDVLNLDVTTTLKSAIEREGLKLPLNLEYSDLHIHPSEYQSSCATVVMLDCSHSMILYGEDRFTPAKRVAMALSHLIRTQFPGDTLSVVLFHDSAEEIPVNRLPRVKVGPHYTNTREGLRVAQRILARSDKDMKQIVMITDGKPSALTLPDGRIYKNAFGLDPLVIAETLEEVSRCKRSNIMINTFMLASDFSLVQFVQKVSAMCRGKAYFTTPETLGNYLLMDFMSRRMKTIH